MADEVTIKSFLVRLGFKTDENSFKKFEQGIARGTFSVTALGVAIEAMAIKVATAVTHFSANLEQLYFMSRRVGDSATNIKSFAAAITNLGGSSSGAMASMENLAKFLRENPSGEGWLGVMTRDAQGHMLGLSDIMSNLAKQFQEEPQYYALARAQAMGIDYRTALAMHDGSYQKELDEQKKINGKNSFEKPSEDAHKFLTNLRNFSNTVIRLLLPVQDAIQKHLQKSLEKVVAYLQAHGQELADKFGKVIDRLLVFLDKLADWFMQHGNQLADDLVAGLNGLLQIIDYLSPKMHVLIDVFKEADAVTGGWVSRLAALALALKFVGLSGPGLAILKFLGWRLSGAIGAGVGIGYAANKYLPNNWFAQIGNWVGGKLFENNDRAKNWQAALEQAGFDPKESAAITMIGHAESGNNPEALNEDGEHYGVMQWSAARQAKFEEMFKHTMTNPGIFPEQKLKEQAQFYWYETHGGDKQATDAYNETHDADDLPLAGLVGRYVVSAQRPGKDTAKEVINALTFGEQQSAATAEALKQAVANSEQVKEASKAQKDAAVKPKQFDTPLDQFSRNINQETTINVTGADDPKRVADLVLDGQKRVNASLTRNFVPNLV